VGISVLPDKQHYVEDIGAVLAKRSKLPAFIHPNSSFCLSAWGNAAFIPAFMVEES
jgi:hypothetical protein